MATNALGKTVASVIRLYQATLSPDHSFWAKAVFGGGYCRFHPSCSEYTRQAVLRYGAAAGLLKGCWRILRCNPFSRGGVDEIEGPLKKWSLRAKRSGAKQSQPLR